MASLPRPTLIAISYTEAMLYAGGLSRSSIAALARPESAAASSTNHSNVWVSSRSVTYR